MSTKVKERIEDLMQLRELYSRLINDPSSCFFKCPALKQVNEMCVREIYRLQDFSNFKDGMDTDLETFIAEDWRL